MKKASLAIFVSLFALAVAAHARGVSGETSGDVSGGVSGEVSDEIRESTDPAKIAEVEQRAAEIIARQQAQEQQTTPQGSGSGATPDSDSPGAGSGMSGQDSGSSKKY